MRNTGIVKAREALSRREFLRLSGAGLAATAALGMVGCGGGGDQNPGKLTYLSSPDPTGTDRQFIDEFNRRNKGEIQVELREAPAEVTQYFDQVRTQFQAGSGSVDVIRGELAWAAQFASSGWISDLSDRFTDEMQADFLSASLKTVTYDGGVYGVPYFSDAGLMYYRRDLLEENGFSEPPKTWEELKEMARTVQEDSGTEFGLVFQGAGYEGGAINALEYVWTHGGDVLDPEDPAKVIINSPESLAGLRTERSMITDEIAPQLVVTSSEADTQGAFLRGNAVFARNWPYMYALAADPEQSRIEQEQVGVSAIPVASEEYQPAGGLGGWNLFINAASEKQDAAWEFVQFMTASEQQKTRATEGSYLPTRESLFDDQKILEVLPVLALGKEALLNARPRPVSPYYQDMALKMSEQFNDALKGDISQEQCLRTLQEELQSILDQG